MYTHTKDEVKGICWPAPAMIRSHTRAHTCSFSQRNNQFQKKWKATLNGMPWYVNMLEINIVAMFFALEFFLTGKKCTYLLNQSTMVHIPILPCVALGSPSTKSMDIHCQCQFCIGNGCNNPNSFPFSYLKFWIMQIKTTYTTHNTILSGHIPQIESIHDWLLVRGKVPRGNEQIETRIYPSKSWKPLF